MSKIMVKDKWFDVYIKSIEIQNKIAELARNIALDFKDEKPIFLSVLTGAFIFTADLFRKMNIDCELAFIKVSSYDGMQSSGNIKTAIGLDNYVEGRSIVIIEDIVDTGNTLEYLFEEVNKLNPSRLKVASLLLKSEAYKKNIPIDYVGFEIPNDFVVGYGLDYDQIGRNYEHIYKLCS